MAKTAQQALAEITAHIKKQGGAYSDWYCGITSNLENRLYGDHKVPKKNHWSITRLCEDSASARAVEKALLDLGCDGGEGGGDEDSRIVYAYLKTSITNP